MTWFTENKIFSTILVVIVLLAATLGYLVFDASGKYQTAVDSYQSGVRSLVGLRGLSPYRNEENLKKIKTQVTDYQDLTTNLHEDLIRKQGEIPAMEPSAFQAKLRDSVSKVIDHANQRGVKLPDKFYLGFDKYENQLPRNDIAGLLSWQLDAIEQIFNRLIDMKVTNISAILRPDLPGELAPEKPSKEVPLLKKYPFEIVYLGYPAYTRNLLNDLEKTPQFMIVRAVKIENEALKSPSRTSDANNSPDAATPAPAINKIIIGKEMVTTTLVIDLVQFNPDKTLKK